MDMKLDLMDWKTIERNSIASINDHKISITISEILLISAKKEIKRLGGKTQEEEEKELKKNASIPEEPYPSV
jgi:hypothetical protein